jgi:hypothetical protein
VESFKQRNAKSLNLMHFNRVLKLNQDFLKKKLKADLKKLKNYSEHLDGNLDINDDIALDRISYATKGINLKKLFKSLKLKQDLYQQKLKEIQQNEAKLKTEKAKNREIFDEEIRHFLPLRF